MRRHRSLVLLSRDHRGALVQARRLRSAGEDADPSTVPSAFLRFFATETVRRFREEEELVFPAVLDFPAVREPLVQALLGHVRVHALTKALRHALDNGRPMTPIMHELGELFVAHIRHEERCLFPLIERLLDDSTLATIELGIQESNDASDWRHAGSEASRDTTPTDRNATLFWGSGGGSHCDAAFLGDRRWNTEDRHRR